MIIDSNPHEAAQMLVAGMLAVNAAQPAIVSEATATLRSFEGAFLSERCAKALMGRAIRGDLAKCYVSPTIEPFLRLADGSQVIGAMSQATISLSLTGTERPEEIAERLGDGFVETALAVTRANCLCVRDSQASKAVTIGFWRNIEVHIEGSERSLSGGLDVSFLVTAHIAAAMTRDFLGHNGYDAPAA